MARLLCNSIASSYVPNFYGRRLSTNGTKLSVAHTFIIDVFKYPFAPWTISIFSCDLYPMACISASGITRFVTNNGGNMSPQCVMQEMAINNYPSR